MTTIFDPAAFLDQTTEQASERRDPIPAMDVNFAIKDVLMKVWESKDKLDEQGRLKSGLKLDVLLDLDLPADLKESMKIDKFTLTDGFIVDLNETRTAIDYGKGKNNRLRMYRDATGLNVAGQPFSPRMLIGRMGRVRITHEEYQGAIMERAGAISKAV